MITIHDANATDFDNNGLGILQPTEAYVEEEAAGMYAVHLVHPIDEDGHWRRIARGRILQVDVPVTITDAKLLRSTTSSITETVSYEIYQVNTRTSNLYLRARPTTSSTALGKYPKGTSVYKLDDAGGGDWTHVKVPSDGKEGYMSATWLKSTSETYTGNSTITETTTAAEDVRIETSPKQRFRIYHTKIDTAAKTITADALHIFYDLAGNVLSEAYLPEKESVSDAVRHVMRGALNPHNFTAEVGVFDASITGDYATSSITNILLDPDNGIVAQSGGIFIRDNERFYILPDPHLDRGIRIRRGKNLIGVDADMDMSSVVTRIVPIGKDANGDMLKLKGTQYVDSARISDYPLIYAQNIEYDVTVDKSGDFPTEAAARAELRRLAEADFAGGADLPEYSLDVDFVILEENESRAYQALQKIHMYEVVTIEDSVADILTQQQLTYYKYNLLTKQYDSVVLGSMDRMNEKVYGYQIQDGSVSQRKISVGALTNIPLGAGAVAYGNLAESALDSLNADALNTIIAYIRQMIVNNDITNQLWQDIKTIANT